MLLFPARRVWTVGLNLVGVVLVALDLTRRSLHAAPAAVVVAAWTAWALWLVVLLLPDSWVRAHTAALLVMVAGGSLAGATTDVVGFVPAAVGLLRLAGSPAVRPRTVGLAGVVAAALTGLSALIDPGSRGATLGVFATLAVCLLGGLSRRQYRTSEAQARALLEERVVLERERARVAALTERSRIARDLHDVLAHSLGGLVVQLEAVDALLESGRATDARDRVRTARALAVAGLNEAREAVSTLREPDRPLSEVVADLAATHRAIGGRIAVRGDADAGALDPAGRDAVHRAVQEMLTNARRHAPGAPVTLDLDWERDTLTVTASTPPGTARGHSPGGGHGLAGMRERVTAAGGTVTVRDGPPFEVELRLPGRAG